MSAQPQLTFHLKTEPKPSPNNEKKPETSAPTLTQRREGRERSAERPADLGSTIQKPPSETPKNAGGMPFTLIPARKRIDRIVKLPAILSLEAKLFKVLRKRRSSQLKDGKLPNGLHSKLTLTQLGGTVEKEKWTPVPRRQLICLLPRTLKLPVRRSYLVIRNRF